MLYNAQVFLSTTFFVVVKITITLISTVSNIFILIDKEFKYLFIRFFCLLDIRNYIT